MKAAQNVARHYSVQTTQKTLDWIAFAGIGVGMYGPRVVAIAVRERGQQPSRGGEVVRFPQRPPFARPQATAAPPAQPAPPVEQPAPTPMVEPEFGEDGGGF